MGQMTTGVDCGFTYTLQSCLDTPLTMRHAHFLLRSRSTLLILESMRNKLVAKKLIHLLQSPALGFWEEKCKAQKGNHVEGEEDVKIPEADRREGVWTELGEDQVDGPVCESRDCIAQSTDLDRINLCRNVSIRMMALA